MSQSTLSTTAWVSAADDVLAVLLTDIDNPPKGYFDLAVDTYQMKSQHFPTGRQRALFNALIDINQRKELINVNTVIASAGDIITLQWYAELIALADGGWDDTIRGETFNSNLQLLKKFGNALGFVERLQSAQTAIRGGSDVEAEKNALMTDLAQSEAISVTDINATVSAQRISDYLSQEPTPIVSSSVSFIDNDTGGFQGSRLWYVAGPYKSSKTRIMSNMALAALDQGRPTSIMSFENSEQTLAAQFICMLAVYWLCKRFEYDPDSSLFWISTSGLLNVRNGYKNWQPKVKAEAIDAAIKRYASYGDLLHIHDRSPSGGSLSDIHSIESHTRRDHRLFGVNTVFGDHLNLVDGVGSIYEKTSAVSKGLQKLTHEFDVNPITIVFLAQLNEATIRDGEGYNAGIKGGGDPSADADVVLTTHPIAIEDSEAGTYYNDRTKLKNKFNRWGPSGESRLIMFHPGSGLIVHDGDNNVVAPKKDLPETSKRYYNHDDDHDE